MFAQWFYCVSFGTNRCRSCTKNNVHIVMFVLSVHVCIKCIIKHVHKYH